jgi:hypothetical protein
MLSKRIIYTPVSLSIWNVLDYGVRCPRQCICARDLVQNYDPMGVTDAGRPVAANEASDAVAPG